LDRQPKRAGRFARCQSPSDQKSMVAAIAGFNSNLRIFVVVTSQFDFQHFPIAAPQFHYYHLNYDFSLKQAVSKARSA
jgi:hypothetical protein